MKLNVFVQGQTVAALESVDSFNYHLTYLPGVDPAKFVSLTMPVQTPSWTWPSLHPFFQVSLPEGFLLSVLKEQLGPHLGASPLDLLSVVGHNPHRPGAGERGGPAKRYHGAGERRTAPARDRLGRDRLHRLPAVRMLALVVQNHPNRSRADLR